jgi:uncharacterized membrane protein YjjB (DUF3815 family)
MNELIQIIAAFFGALGFALLFNIHQYRVFWTAFGGFLAWCVYLASGFVVLSYGQQYFIAAFFLGIYSEILAIKTKAPSTLYLAVGMIPLIPGAALYMMMQHAVGGEWSGFKSYGLEAVITGAAIASGIITAMMCWNLMKTNLLKK